MEAPRKDFRILRYGSDQKAYPDVEAIYRMPESLGLVGFVGPAGPLWRCPDCGTYYYFEVFNRGRSCQTYLWRLTPAEAMEPEPYGFWPRLGTPEYEEFHRYEQRLPQWKHEMQACLGHSDSVVRERAAQALASHFRARSELDGFNALLGYADASIRRGALLAFDSIRFIRFERGPADIVPALLKSLMDPDTSVARQAFVLLSRVDDEKKRKQILDHVNAIPAGRRTAGVRMFLPTFEALVAGLADPEKEVRQEAWSKALTLSLRDTAFVERLRTALRAVPEADRTSEMERYLSLENPDAWDDDD